MTFTKEQLIAHIKGRKEFADECASDSTFHPERREYYELSAAALEIALASLEAEPVAWRWNYGGSTNWRLQECDPGTGDNDKCPRVAEPLYTAPPAPVSVPAAMEMDDDFDSAFEHGKAAGWNDCRAAMLQSFGNSEQLNSPVIPDGWVMVPEEPTHEMLEAGDEQFGTYDVYRRMIAASPQQEA